ncbi:MAG: xanthine dehydrogenase family protein molybdopterin-binding subunit [Deltaproteobacteria bacterium]|nr:xanthine dehydrogenase family protein molybdopterin-binding subunit [Deltaproteobacteria bacterium]
MHRHTWIGKRVAQRETADRLSARLAFGADLRPDGALVVLPVLGGQANARLVGLDLDAARSLPGVQAVLLARDVPGYQPPGEAPILCADRIGCATDAVALVVAESAPAAREAAAALQPEIAPDPEWCVPADPLDAAGLPSCRIAELRFERGGEIDRCFAQGVQVAERDFRLPVIPARPDFNAGACEPDAQQRIVLRSASRDPRADKERIARLLGLPEERVRVEAPAGGGLFDAADPRVGLRLALACQHTGRAVRYLQPERAPGPARSLQIRLGLAAARGGRLSALCLRLILDLGAYATREQASEALRALVIQAAGPYRIPCVRIEALAVRTTHGVWSGPAEAFYSLACTALESQLDALARKLGANPLTLRRDNLLEAEQESPAGIPLAGIAGGAELTRALRRSKLYSLRRQRKRTRADLPPALARRVRRGVGLACHLCPLPASGSTGLALTLHADGGARIELGASDWGRAICTAVSLLLAERLDIDPERIEVSAGMSEVSGAELSGAGGMQPMARAVEEAALAAERALGQRARDLLGWPPGAVRLRAGELEGPDARRAGVDRLIGPEGLRVQACASSPETFCLGAHVALVELDELTGELAVEAIEAHLDAGLPVNRSALERIGRAGCALGASAVLGTGPGSSLDAPAEIAVSPIAHGGRPARGLGGAPIASAAAAVLNALADATRARGQPDGLQPGELPVAQSELAAGSGEAS